MSQVTLLECFCQDFADLLRERRWKIGQAKRFAKLVSKSNLDVEGRERTRRKEELQNIKKRAAWIAKEVYLMWKTSGHGVLRRLSSLKILNGHGVIMQFSQFSTVVMHHAGCL